jgi:hypothetical protein
MLSDLFYQTIEKFENWIMSFIVYNKAAGLIPEDSGNWCLFTIDVYLNGVSAVF